MISEAWARAATARALLCVDPLGLGGVLVRGRAGPVRDRFMEGFAPALPLRRIHPGVGDDALFGGVDLTETLAAGRFARRKGLLDEAATIVLPMAERASPGLAARLGGALDRGGVCLVALDEGAAPDEATPTALKERLALHVDLTDFGWRETAPIANDDVDKARARLPSVSAPDDALAALAAVAARLGIASLRAPIFALRAARASAALFGRELVGEDDLRLAVELVLAPRATVLPEDAGEDEAPPPDPKPEDRPPADETPDAAKDEETRIPEEVLLEAAKALLPPDLLARVAAAKAARSRTASSGAGAKRKGAARGRPLPSRPGRLGGGARIDVIAMLSAAAPWQGVRAKPPGARLAFRPSDIRVKRYEERTERLVIFAVDASGSAAFARLAEAKGAVELLLAEAYARRDQVALVAFRGEGADILLPPTRSLVQAKRRLSALPGGGGTPLAAGLRAALELGLSEQGKGRSPVIALLTDGRANIDLAGDADRASAAADADAIARSIRARGVPAIVVDMGARPEKDLASLAATLDAPYIPLPRADGARISAAVGAAIDG